MKKVNFKLQNIILKYNKGLDDNWWMMYRGDRFEYKKLESCHYLEKNRFVEFFTYLNSFSIAKWKKYAKVGKLYLNLKVKGQFKIEFMGHYRESDRIEKEIFPPLFYNCSEITELMIPLPTDPQATVISFQINSISSMKIYSGYYSTIVPEEDINDVFISIATTTFNKEDYIRRNVDILEKNLFYSDEPAAKHFFMRIVDNGRTLDPDEFDSEYIKVYPNQNVGGAGGFTRGMLESLDAEQKPTHVLLMDDDVMILPESLIRTYTMLSLVKKQYDTNFVSGAMLFFEQMNVQHEDVGFLNEEGAYGPRKPGMAMHLWDSVFRNEEEYSKMPNSYAGWWYCCIPVKTIDTNDLPVPLFIRGDDVEYSAKQNADFITLNGICIWHRGFANKYNAALELYLVHRNSLIIQAMSGIGEGVDFVERIDEFFWKEIKRLSYNSCELLLDALEDFLNGPEFMMTPQGERIVKEHSAKNEKMLPVETYYKDIFIDYGGLYREDKQLTSFQQFIYDKTCNGQMLPNFMLKKENKVIPYDWYDANSKQYLAKTVLAVNWVDHTGYMRHRSRKVFLQLCKRHKRLMKYYKKNRSKIENQYRESSKTLKSESFWRNYLEMNK